MKPVTDKRRELSKSRSALVRVISRLERSEGAISAFSVTRQIAGAIGEIDRMRGEEALAVRSEHR